jgi:predicted RND superfamily exporter protein
VVLSAMTTIVGFGSLATSRYPGLRSVGYVATLGCLSCAIVAVTLLPALLAIGRRDASSPSAGD